MPKPANHSSIGLLRCMPIGLSLMFCLEISSVANPVNVQRAIHESRQALGEGRPVDALALAEKAVELDPAFGDAWKQYGRVLMLNGQFSEALTALDRAWMLNPAWSSEVPLWRAGVLLNLSKHDDFRIFIRSMPEAGLRTLPRRIVFQWLNRLCESGQKYTAAVLAGRCRNVESDPAIMELYRILIDDLQVPCVNYFAEINPAYEMDKDSGILSGLIFEHRANAYMTANNPEQAEHFFLKSHEADSTRFSALRDLGWLYRRAGRLDDAINTWAKGMENLDPSRSGWTIWMAEAACEMGKFEEALARLQPELDKHPPSAKAVELRHWIFLQTGKFKDAEVLESEVQLDSDAYRSMLQGRIRFVQSSRDADLAMEQLRRMLGVNAAPFMSDTCLALASNSSFHVRNRRLEEATAIMPESFHALRELAWFRWNDGKDKEAIELWNRAMSLAHPETNRLLVDVVDILVANRREADVRMLVDGFKDDSSWMTLAKLSIDQTQKNAAIYFLERAGERKDERVTSALFLSLLHALEGNCNTFISYLTMISTNELPSLDHLQLDVLYELVHFCDEAELNAIRKAVTDHAGREPFHDKEITAILTQNARILESRGDRSPAYRIYQRVIARDPGNDAWLNVIALASTFENAKAMDDLVETAVRAPVRPAMQSRLQSLRSRRAGRIPSAITQARDSLEHDSAQSDLRRELFDMLIADGRLEEAVEEVNWFGLHIHQPGFEPLPALSHMLVTLSRQENALTLWGSSCNDQLDRVAVIHAVSDYFATQCQVEQASELLSASLQYLPDSRLYVLKSESELALGHYDEAIDWADRGINEAPSPALYRMRAELAELVYDWPSAYSNASTYSKLDPGYAPMQQLAARSLEMMGRDIEAREQFDSLLRRNEFYLPALLGLYESSLALGRFDQALVYAEKHYRSRPDDPDAVRNLAWSQAQSGSHESALQSLQVLADRPVHQAIPVLLYRAVSDCSLEGRNSVEQLQQHISQLKEHGYRFVTPDQISEDDQGSGQKIMIVLVDPVPNAIPSIDTILDDHGARAVLAVNIPEFRQRLAGIAGRHAFDDLLQSGRWFIASSGPADSRRQIISPDQTLGNPFTHRIMRVDGMIETLAQMEDRLDAIFRDAAGTVPGPFSVLVYPEGDYGQLSLDCGRDEMDILKKIVERHFNMAIAQDGSGFITPGYDLARTPALVVPSAQTIYSISSDDTADILQHIAQKNPILQAKLDMARILSGHRQYARANAWFSHASELGADPASVMLYWGASALEQGDIPNALKRLRSAKELGSPKHEEILDRLEAAERFRQPVLTLQYDGWTDNDDREFHRVGGRAQFHLHDHVRLGIFADAREYKHQHSGSEQAQYAGVDGRWFVAPERWFDAGIWGMEFNDHRLDEQWGGWINLHSKSRILNGQWDLTYRRDPVPTVEAVREDIQADTVSLDARSMVFDRIDVNADGHYTSRTDHNDTWLVNGQLLYRVIESPSLGVGYSGQWADSDRSVAEYYAPLELERHAAIGSIRHTSGNLHYAVTAEWGMAEEAGEDWVNVWNVDAWVEFQLSLHKQVFGGYSRFETPEYELNSWKIGLNSRF